MSKSRVLLADDHQFFRGGVAAILNAQPDFEVVGEAGDGLEVLVKARALQPDLILMDIGMPGCDGVEATHLIKQELPDIVIVMLSVRNEDENLFEAIKGGAQGFLLKTIHADDLLELLRGALRGEAAISPALGGRMLEEFRRLSALDRPALEGEEVSLTGREQEVLNLIACGATDREIANALILSIHTVKTHVRNILAKLHLGHRYEASQYALHKGLISGTGDKLSHYGN
jgi:two-component system nitrate/nitrite response regulator NarL